MFPNGCCLDSTDIEDWTKYTLKKVGGSKNKLKKYGKNIEIIIKKDKQ